MSKIAPYLALYLQQHNSLSLQNLGSFTHNNNVETIHDKDAELAPIQFNYDNKAITNDGFILLIMKELGKMRSLAISDIETFISTGKQLLNISKPFTIEGLGSINRSSRGEYSFAPGTFAPPKINTESAKERQASLVKETAKTNALNYDRTYGASIPKNKGIAKKVIGAIAFFALLGALGFVLYKYVFSKNFNELTVSTPKTTTPNTAKDTTTKPKTNTVVSVPDSLGRTDFKLVVRITDSISAYKRLNQFKDSRIELAGYQSSSVVKDNTNNTYKVVMLFKAKPADTALLRTQASTNYGTANQQAYFMQ